MDLVPARTADERVNTFLELSPDPIVVVDGGATIVAVNAPMVDLCGYDEADLVGQRLEMLVPRRLREGHVAHRDAYAANPTTRPMGLGRELTLRSRSGREVAVDIALRPLPVVETNLIAAVIRDVSAAKAVQEELRETHRRLRGTIDALSDANDRLELAAQFQQEFISTASHELRTPLTAVTGFSEMLVDRWDDLDETRRRDAIGAIHRNATRQLALVNDMAHAAHIQMGGLKLRMATVALAPALEEAVASVANADAFHLDITAALVTADEGRLIQIVINLMTNALRYGAAPYRLATEEVNGEIRIHVSDQGPGVPPTFIAEMFEAFAQASTGTRREARGTGLGLYISRSLATAMEGELSYSANPEGGSIFTLALQRATAS